MLNGLEGTLQWRQKQHTYQLKPRNQEYGIGTNTPQALKDCGKIGLGHVMS